MGSLLLLNANLSTSTFQSHVAGCRFCTLGAEHNNHYFFDKHLVRTPHYSVIASLGAMVPGWILIVPTNHILNMSDRYVDHELAMLRSSISETLKNEFSLPVRMFEHGAMRRGSQTGCGVDHAHLHMLPFRNSLRDSILEFKGSLEWSEVRASEIRSVVGENEYLFYSDDSSSPNPLGILAIVTEATSQFFRQVIARELGRDDEYDYRENHFEEHIRQTQVCFNDTTNTNKIFPSSV